MEETEFVALEKKVCEMLMKQGKGYTKSAPTKAVLMDHPFEIETSEGTMQGYAGDFLAMDAVGNFYPISAEVFAASYRPARSPKKKKANPAAKGSPPTNPGTPYAPEPVDSQTAE